MFGSRLRTTVTTVTKDLENSRNITRGVELMDIDGIHRLQRMGLFPVLTRGVDVTVVPIEPQHIDTFGSVRQQDCDGAAV